MAGNAQQRGGNSHGHIPGFLKAKCPVFLPQHEALFLDAEKFEQFLQVSLRDGSKKTMAIETDTIIDASNETTAGRFNQHPRTESNDDKTIDGAAANEDGLQGRENTMRTENNDVAFISTKNPLVDLFFELDDTINGERLQVLLEAAWAADSSRTLKIIFHARSIHLGKSSRDIFYRCCGWLAKTHPLTLLANLRWLVRPVIPKKLDKTENEDAVMVETSEALGQLQMAEKEPSDNNTEYDVKNGVAHGYWKDILNILALSANGLLDVMANPRDILNIVGEKEPEWSKDKAREKRRAKRSTRHETVIDLFTNDPLHRAIHLAAARLFADQLQSDLVALNGQDEKAKSCISLSGKWAPSTDRFHDKHTFVTSSIAELMHPDSSLVDQGIPTPSTNDEERTLYLRYAREAYRRDISALRRHLDVVEPKISANTLEKIDYQRVPSLAMHMHAPTFIKKDPERFKDYIGQVAIGKLRISGATMLPSTLIKAIRGGSERRRTVGKKRVHADMVEAESLELKAQVADGQWKTLVQRIKDSGTLPSSLAVCDVSGSMKSPVFPDETCPMDTAIGMSLLLAEVAEPPFRGRFITFSSHPTIQTIDVSTTLRAKYLDMARSDWGMNTDFEAVFTKLLLPMAIQNKVKQEDMVKRIFVFSDMHFDQAATDDWSTSYERIERAYREAGYETPELVFWNLAGSRGYDAQAAASGSHGWHASTPAPKPATVAQKGLAMVSGYSQGMLKVFLDNGMFDEESEEVVENVVVDDDGDELVEVAVKKPKLDPVALVNKAISHPAYAMLQVVD